MKKFKFDKADYLVVEVSDPIKQKYIGIKCIPARWTEKALGENYFIIRYPEEESFETELQIKNKKSSNPTWPHYYALIMFVTGVYENACKALDFLTEKDLIDLPTTADELPNNAELSEGPSTSFKRKSSDENEVITTNEDILPKKKRESAIRSENNLKILIQTGQLLSNKQKVSPKKLLSIPKEVHTETLEKLINTERFDKIDKMFSDDKTAEAHETVEIISSSDDSDNDGEPETLCPPINYPKSALEAVLKNMPYPTNATKKHNSALQSGKTPERSKTQTHQVQVETVVTNTSQKSATDHLKQNNTNMDGAQSTWNAELSTLGDLIQNVSPNNSGNGTKNNISEDINRLEDIYNSIIGAKSSLNDAFMKRSEGLRKAFQSINLVVPELKQGLSLPTIQQLREKKQRTIEEPQPSTSRQQ